jgi:hypothetical protein
MSFSLFTKTHADTILDPQHTWIFAVGVLQFDDATFTTWPDKDRQDARMLSEYHKRGVPSDHILFMKNEHCTSEALKRQFHQFLSKPQAGDTLIFYYAGHGDRDQSNDARPVSFVTYDTAVGWPVLDVLGEIERSFQGANVILTADCCYSGGLIEAVSKHHEKFSVAAFTSSQPTSSSTGNWTFTQGLADAIAGNPLVDLNGDGTITLGELADYQEREMAYAEGQLPCTYFSGNLTRKGYDSSQDSWVDGTLLRPVTFKSIAKGTHASIESEGKRYPGEVLDQRLGLYLVHYDDYPDIDNEWVEYSRLKIK